MRLRDPGCAESEDELALGASSPEMSARVRAHREHCPRCQALAAASGAMAEVVVEAAGPELDEITRARIASKLQAEMDAAVRRVTERPAPLLGRLRWVGAAAAIVLLTLGAMALLRPPVDLGRSRAVLTPYAAAGSAARGGSAMLALGDGLERIAVPAGGLVRATLGSQGRMTLIGPALVEVREVGARAITLELREGTLVGEWEHGGKSQLVLLARGLEARVVGTRFLLRCPSGSEEASLAVLEGQVEVERQAGSVLVGAGEALDTKGKLLSSLDPRDQDAFAEAAAALGPPLLARGSGVILVAGAPESALVKAGGARIGPAPIAAIVPAGQVELDISAPGYTRVQRDAEIRAGATTSLGFALEALPPPEPLPPVPVPTPLPSVPPVAATRPSAKPATVAVPAEPSAEVLYREAEAAMRAGDRETARERLERLLRLYPEDASAEPALYDLGRLAYEEGDTKRAGEAVERLLARGHDKGLREAASYLRCRLALGRTDDGRWLAEVVGCFRDFRRDFPGSSHDPEVLLLLATAWARAGQCEAARPLLDEYLDRYSALDGAVTARDWKARCADK
ncbi:MAG: tetratricopeptide repeat protein [Myxococcota bacterium]